MHQNNIKIQKKYYFKKIFLKYKNKQSTLSTLRARLETRLRLRSQNI
jgi:hypothetical protein